LGDRVQAPVVLDEIRKRDVVLTAVATTTTPSLSADLARRTGLVRENVSPPIRSIVASDGLVQIVRPRRGVSAEQNTIGSRP
jgi:hypothetical protein